MYILRVLKIKLKPYLEVSPKLLWKQALEWEGPCKSLQITNWGQRYIRGYFMGFKGRRVEEYCSTACSTGLGILHAENTGNMLPAKSAGY